uniref:late competence development ComFB family protein n=1 Tax=uncultured Flavonifractor sp. TaxID=1193534 RepID=UPI0026289246|nr:late competence development ComFB family protein [uncultured Flavonifractor sp.]
MAGKKGSRTSKTDHVLSLLSGGGKEEPQTTAEQEQTPSPAPEQPKADPAPKEKKEKAPVRAKETPKEEEKVQEEPVAQEKEAHPAQPARREGERLTAPILQVARTNHEALSETIRGALSQALEEELAETQPEQIQESELMPEPVPKPELELVPVEVPAPTLEPISVPQPVPAPEPAPAPEAVAVPEPTPAPDPVPAPAPDPTPKTATRPEPTIQPEEAPFLPREVKLPDGAVCVNVMELLVEERLERYVRMFGLCTCPRCLADARALALTRLPSKYVVLNGDTAIPTLSLYRSKFESMIIAQVIQACKSVMESPRHIL